MYKTFAVAAASLTLVLASLCVTATSARASNDDIAKLIIGALAIGIIAKGISDAKSKDRQPAVTSTRTDAVMVIQPNPTQARPIPAHCAREARIGHHGRITKIYRRSCLRREGVQTQRADNCVRTGTIHGRTINYYTNRCLRRAGFQV